MKKIKKLNALKFFAHKIDVIFKSAVLYYY